MPVSQPYIVTTPPASASPVTRDEFKSWAKVNNSLQDSVIDQILAGVTLEAEKYTKRDFLSRTYETYRDVFGDLEESPRPVGTGESRTMPITIRRSPLDSVNSISYLKDGSPVALDLADIEILVKSDFSKIIPAQNKSWPIPDKYPQAITIEFVAGYGVAADVPQDLKNALLIHATAVFYNRGDCGGGSGSGSCACKFAPPEALSIYNQYRIIDFRA